jgi:hypothetical protein
MGSNPFAIGTKIKLQTEKNELASGSSTVGRTINYISQVSGSTNNPKFEGQNPASFSTKIADTKRVL